MVVLIGTGAVDPGPGACPDNLQKRRAVRANMTLSGAYPGPDQTDLRTSGSVRFQTFAM